MAILSNSIPVGAQVPANPDVIGGGLIVAVHIGAGGNSTDYFLEASEDGGTTWGPVTDEAGAALKVVYSSYQTAQINPPVRAPFFRLNGDTNEADAALVYKVHTV